MKRLLVLICMLLLLTTPVFAEAPDIDTEEPVPNEVFEQQLEASGAGDLMFTLPNETQEYLQKLGIDKISIGSFLNLEPLQFFKIIWLMIKDTLAKPRILFFSILGIIILCSLVDGFKEGFLQKPIGGVFSTVSVLCIIAGIIGPVWTCIQNTAQAVENCSNFMLGFVPVLSGIMSVSGQPVTASTYSIFLFSAAELVSQIASSTVVPLLCIYLAFCIISAVSPQINIAGVAKMIKSSATWILGFIITVFVALLGVQTIVSTGADSVALKAGKFLIGSFVPVVGGALADAVTSVGGCLTLLKNVVGGFGIVSASIIFLPVLVESAVWYLTLNISAAVSDIFELKSVSEVLKASATAVSLLMTIILCFALLLIVTTTITLMISSGAA
ncbi:stage III sporulation protein AE [Acetanaerobacterium elongatum]|uniref:Stage III sporulation protein AE n=2 Tax=Acetanaerobacterium elongatum TaxID=258515 RepID=A0A1H0AR47_9FIRM|nr:stage III sporulation protein AE [Acetanaerobacterium elongatum]